MKRLLVLMLLCATAVVRADDWAAPVVREVFSESREWFVRVVPGAPIVRTFGSAGSAGGAEGPYAKAEFYRRHPDRSYRLVSERTLVNPLAPFDFFVTNRGYLATIDNWAGLGYGKIAVFYSPAGDLLKAFELKDLFTVEEIDQFSHSVSSISWRSAQTAHTCRTTNLDRKWSGYVEPKLRP